MRHWIFHVEFLILLIVWISGVTCLWLKMDRSIEKIDKYTEKTDRLYEEFYKELRKNSGNR